MRRKDQLTPTTAGQLRTQSEPSNTRPLSVAYKGWQVTMMGGYVHSKEQRSYFVMAKKDDEVIDLVDERGLSLHYESRDDAARAMAKVIDEVEDGQQ